MRDGGRGRAERDFREFSGWAELKEEEEEDTKGEGRRTEGGIEEHSIQGGGRARAERDFQECVRRTALGEEDGKGHAQGPEGEVIEHTIPEEPVHIAESPTSRNCALQQLQTPPNTFVERKKERPSSWDVNEESCKKTKYVGDDGTLEGPRGSEPELTLLYDGIEYPR